MYNVFISGNDILKNELLTLIAGYTNLQQSVNDDTDIIFELTAYPENEKRKNIELLDSGKKEIPVFTNSICFAASEQSPWSSYPERLIGIGIYSTFSLSRLIEIAPSKITNENVLSKAEEYLKRCNIRFAKVPDRPALIFPRVISMIINEAAQVYSEDIATRDDIDTAMKLGTNYPLGPLEWADNIGIDNVYNILLNLQRYFGEDRYRPHPSLKEMFDLKLLGKSTGKGYYKY